MIRRLAKWAVVVVLAAEWYARGGRDFLFGEQPETFGVGDVIRTWVDLDPDWNGDLSLPLPLLNAEDEQIGQVTKVRPKEDARDFAGHPAEQAQVYVEVERARVGYPINVALAEVADLARDAVAAATAA